MIFRSIYSRILVFLFIPVLFSGCRDEVDLRCADENLIRINPEAREHFYFKPGTWWLYEQEGTGLTDSIWVSDSRVIRDNNYGKRACQCGYGKCIELAGMTLQNRAYNGKDHLYSHSLSSSFYDGQTSVYGSVPDFRNGFSPVAGNWLFLGKDQMINGNSGGGIVESQDTLTVNGKLYSDLLHAYNPSSNYGNAWLHDVWIARNFYVVRYIRFDNTVWNLVSCNIVQ